MANISLRSYNQEIEAMVDRGSLDEAVAHCQHILKSFPKHLETYRLLGKAYLEARRYNEAVDIFSRVLVAEPSDFVAQVGMSIIRDDQNKLDEAIWHMERAFEAQPSNAAIQGELQRLYGRRDGVQPPRIRMTRGALANMYMQGELYPQAISESKAVLKEDPDRSDMQVLLARAYYRSGQKNDAADAASTVLQRYPYCLEANRVLGDILGPDRPDAAQTYVRRVIELDPYAAHVDNSLYQAADVNDGAVTLNKLDWDGQSGSDADWGSSQGISLRSTNEQPDWLKLSAPSVNDPSSSQAPFISEESKDEIPDFLKVAGWGESTGAFDESKSSMFDDTSSSKDQPIAGGDIPDWVKAMAPSQDTEAPSAQEEELPDWINKIGTGELKIPAPEVGNESTPDWLRQEDNQGASSDENPLSFLSEPPVDEKSSSKPVDMDGTKPLGISQQDEDASLAWLEGLAAKQGATEGLLVDPNDRLDETPDWIKEAKGLDDVLTPSEEPMSMPVSSISAPSTASPSASEQDDAISWLEGLAAKQGATEGLLVNPEDRKEEEPDWVKQSMDQNSQRDEARATDVDSGNLGKSASEQDDAISWLEGLAAKQGATEGLLVNPEDRKEEEPEWVKQSKSESSSQPIQDSMQTESTEDLGKTDEERDDSFSWLENLAAKQGATEGLLTKPEDRMEDEPEWVKKAKAAPPENKPEPVQSMEIEEDSSSVEQEDDWMKHAREVGEKFFADSMGDFDDEAELPVNTKPTAEESFTKADDTAAWLKSLDEPEDDKPVAVEENDDLPAWMQDIDQNIAGEPQDQEQEDETVPSDAGMPNWLEDLEQEEPNPKRSKVPGDLPAWMRDETGEVVAEPTKIEPTRSTDWTPVVENKSGEGQVDEKSGPPKSESKSPNKPAPVKKQEKVESTPAFREPLTRKGTGLIDITVDPVLDTARSELSRSNIPGALETYGKLIKKGRFLEEVIYDLREAIYRYPVEVSIWQSLGDAYMRANQLQDALDAYTKAEELLR